MRSALLTVLIVILMFLPLAAAQPPDTPPGLADRFDLRNDDGSINWPTVAASVGTIMLLGAISYLLHRRYQSGPVTVQSDEEAVLALLEDHDGTMKQPELRDALDWSDSKISRVTSRLESDGTIEKYQLGRENIVKRVED